jgi:hypothetical protein
VATPAAAAEALLLGGGEATGAGLAAAGLGTGLATASAAGLAGTGDTPGAGDTSIRGISGDRPGRARPPAWKDTGGEEEWCGEWGRTGQDQHMV